VIAAHHHAPSLEAATNEPAQTEAKAAEHNRAGKSWMIPGNSPECGDYYYARENASKNSQ
jgi:hypothetical protein